MSGARGAGRYKHGVRAVRNKIGEDRRNCEHAIDLIAALTKQGQGNRARNALAQNPINDLSRFAALTSGDKVENAVADEIQCAEAGPSSKRLVNTFNPTACIELYGGGAVVDAHCLLERVAIFHAAAKGVHLRHVTQKCGGANGDRKHRHGEMAAVSGANLKALSLTCPDRSANSQFFLHARLS